MPKEGLIESAATKRMYEELLDDALSQQIAESGQLGLAKQIEEQLRIAEMQSQLATQSRNNTLPNSASAV